MFKYFNFLLLAILLLIFSCDEELKPVIEGCTNETACNYNSDATMDDDSCTYAEENYDCDGNCTAEVDCAGECGGDAMEDECGVCDGTGIPNEKCDCAGNLADCAGECGGSAVEDECGVCGGGNANMDCAGECGGSAVEDECGVCGGSVVDPAECSGYGCMDETACNYDESAWLNCDGCCKVLDDCGLCGGNNDCIGCNDWYMENFICDNDDTDSAGKCCIDNENNSDYRCKLASVDGTNCKVLEQVNENPFCRLEYEMECNINPDTYNCDYDGVYIGQPCSSTEVTFTPGLGKCVKKCIGQNCLNIICDTNPTDNSCIYPGVAVGQPCSSTNNEFTVGAEGECMLYTDDDTYSIPQYLTYYNTGCEDGTDGCCSYTCDEPFTLTLEYIDASTLQVNYSSTEAIGGFQFNIVGATTTGGSGGGADANGLLVSGSNNLVIGFSISGSTIPTGSGTLTNLNVDTGVSTQLCLQNVVISDPSGDEINSCPEYWQLTCIPIP